VSGERTERPTPRRLASLRRRGEVPVSRELTGAASLLAGLVALALAGPSLLAALAGLLRAGLLDAVGEEPAPGAALRSAAAAVLRLTAVPALAAFAAALAAGTLQTGGLLALGPIAPRLDRLDPARGLARILSAARLAALGLGALKAALLAAAALHGWRATASALSRLPGAGSPGPAVAALLGPLAWRLSGALLLLGGADWLLTRWRHRRRARMSREEVRREAREDEGDPRHRAERRRVHRALAEAAPVARATCLVVNPTHVAVALHHRRGSGEAPRVLAKGAGAAAARLRSQARRAGVPVVRDPPLARALHRLAEVGDEIPEELYDAAAAVLAHLHGAPPPEAG
jgi:type III secretion protein U